MTAYSLLAKGLSDLYGPQFLQQPADGAGISASARQSRSAATCSSTRLRSSIRTWRRSGGAKAERGPSAFSVHHLYVKIAYKQNIRYVCNVFM